jgi:hypothetical protein
VLRVKRVDKALFDTTNHQHQKDGNDSFDKAFYYGSGFIQVSTYIDFSDSVLYGLDQYNSSIEPFSFEMSLNSSTVHYTVWNDKNELPLVIVFSKSQRTAYGLFLFTSSPAEVVTVPSK